MANIPNADALIYVTTNAMLHSPNTQLGLDYFERKLHISASEIAANRNFYVKVLQTAKKRADHKRKIIEGRQRAARNKVIKFASGAVALAAFAGTLTVLPRLSREKGEGSEIISQPPAASETIISVPPQTEVKEAIYDDDLGGKEAAPKIFVNSERDVELKYCGGKNGSYLTYDTMALLSKGAINHLTNAVKEYKAKYGKKAKDYDMSKIDDALLMCLIVRESSGDVNAVGKSDGGTVYYGLGQMYSGAFADSKETLDMLGIKCDAKSAEDLVGNSMDACLCIGAYLMRIELSLRTKLGDEYADIWHMLGAYRKGANKVVDYYKENKPCDFAYYPITTLGVNGEIYKAVNEYLEALNFVITNPSKTERLNEKGLRPQLIELKEKAETCVKGLKKYDKNVESLLKNQSEENNK